MRLYQPEDGERLPGDPAGLGVTRPEWHALLDDLLELNRAGRLGWIRAATTAELARARRHGPPADEAIDRDDGATWPQLRVRLREIRGCVQQWKELIGNPEGDELADAVLAILDRPRETA